MQKLFAKSSPIPHSASEMHFVCVCSLCTCVEKYYPLHAYTESYALHKHGESCWCRLVWKDAPCMHTCIERYLLHFYVGRYALYMWVEGDNNYNKRLLLRWCQQSKLLSFTCLDSEESLQNRKGMRQCRHKPILKFCLLSPSPLSHINLITFTSKIHYNWN